MLGNVPTRHFYSPCETKTTLLHLSPTSCKQDAKQYAIYCNSSHGPSFGIGHDLHICNNPQRNQLSYSYFGHTYHLPPGYALNSEQANNLLAGQLKFVTTEVEVFY